MPVTDAVIMDEVKLEIHINDKANVMEDTTDDTQGYSSSVKKTDELPGDAKALLPANTNDITAVNNSNSNNIEIATFVEDAGIGFKRSEEQEMENHYNEETPVAATTTTAAVVTTDLATSTNSDTIINKEEEENTIASSSSSSLPHRKRIWVSSKQKIINRDNIVAKVHPNLHSHEEQESFMLILSLPIDSLHTIASFLTPIEWTNFGLCNKGTNKICTEIFRRVRMHGFRCATEVITALKFGQHADSKELCALYVSEGVPIYPHSFGHSYHTLIWRLSIEVKHLQMQQTTNKSSTNTSEPEIADRQAPRTTENSDNNVQSRLPQLDAFYNERDDSRMREELSTGSPGSLTYLEEKALYNINATDNELEDDRVSRTNRRRMSIDWRAMHPFHTIGLPHPQELHHAPLVQPNNRHIEGRIRTRWNSLIGMGRNTLVLPHRQMTRSNSFSGNRFRSPNVRMKIHRHLLDQHLLGRPGVNDGEGLMTAPPVNISADFFHPFFSFRSSTETVRYQNSGTNNTAAANNLLPAYNQSLSSVIAPPAGIDDNASEAVGTTTVTDVTNNNDENLGDMDDSDSDVEEEVIYPRPTLLEPTRLNNLNERVTPAAEAALQPPTMAPTIPSMTNSGHRASSTTMHSGGQGIIIHNNILSNIDLKVYSTSSSGFKSDDDENASGEGEELNNYLKTRFALYHRYLDKHFSNNDNDSFEECIMDLWDEFFPQTANIQYYDKHTAVPRISRLDKFLTKPCPKAIGIVQCEIERVKLGSKKKGVNMKGRFFPTYEYRLFIRHRPSDTTSDIDDTDANNNNKKVRCDTVLMTAKNRGRKNTENAGQPSSITSTKKGSNNYYLHLPRQDDLDLHYKSVNVLEGIPLSAPNGPGSQITTSEFSGLLGRLQSNFVGTEFQIFTPRPAMMKTKSLVAKSIAVRQSLSAGVSSDEDMLHESDPPIELCSSATARRRSRFRRLSLRGRSSNNGDKQKIVISEASENVRSHSSSLTLRRSHSSGDVVPGRKARPSRKVSAAETFESQHYQVQTQPAFFEEEDGAITYTANLLGSRPRIMDVCIPKVNTDGPGMEWKRYLENCKEHDPSNYADRLLNHLKQLQQNGQIDEYGRLINPANNNTEVLGTDEIEYSPPGDFGLLALQNRPPWWNVELGSFVLNFGGRVSVASVKNFQLCDRSDQDYIMLQFGRIEGRHSFTMDLQYPLTAVQAFAIAISSLQSKISFG